MGGVLSYPQDLIGGGLGWGLAPAQSGAVVTEFTAMQCAAYFACIRIISDQIASLPLGVFELRDDGSEVRNWDHPLARLLDSQPNPECSAPDFRQAAQGHLLLNGNAYIEIVYNNGGSPAALYLRSPFRTMPWRDMKTGELVYKTTDTMDSHERRIPTQNMIHLKGFSFDGIVGLSPVKVYAKETLGVDLAAQSYAAKFFANDTRPGGYLKAPGITTDKQRLQSITSWTAAHSQQNTHKMAILDNGWTWEKVGTAPEEAQFIQTRQLNRAQIAAIFGVPSHMVGDTSDEPRANLEQKGIEFLNYTIRPWTVKWQGPLNARLFPAGGKVFCKFDTTNLERTSFDVLLKGIQMGRYAGLLTMNDGRKLLKLPPVVENDFDTTNPADKFWMPVNMYVVSEDQPEPVALDPVAGDKSQGGVGGDDTTGGSKPPKNGKPAVNARPFVAPFNDAFARILSRTKPSEKDYQRTFAPVLVAIAMSTRDEDLIPEELAGFIRDYIRFMADRASTWTKDSAAGELDRAMREIGKKSGEVAPQNGEGDDDEKGI